MFRLRKGYVAYFTVLCLLGSGLMAALAVTPTPVPTEDFSAAGLVSTGGQLVTNLSVFPIIFAGAIIGVAVYLFRRFKSGAR